MMNAGFGVRLTPNNSPSVRYPASLRSPIKSHHDELSLSLDRVIGSTTVSPNGFDCQNSKRRFAYTAGAAAVIADVDDDLHITQRFYRARPTVTSSFSPISHLGPGTPTRTANEQEPKNKTVSSLREAGVGRDPADSPTRSWADSPGSKPWAAKERVKAATAVSLSPDGRFLAVGETGYKPRVLVFAADDGRSNDSPLASMAEHSYGVQCVAFSPDSQFLASLGNINDGFLHIWRIGHRGNASLHASAKCTSNVRQIAWTSSALIAVGVRYTKVWRLETPSEPASPRKARPSEFGSPMLMSPSARSLPGRNVILGDLLESTFTAVVAMAANAAAVCSDRGDICILDVANGQQTLRKVANIGFPVFSMAFDGENLIMAGEKHNIRVLSSTQINSGYSDAAEAATPKSSQTKRSENIPYTAAISYIGKHIITIDSHNGVEIFREIRSETKLKSDDAVELAMAPCGGPQSPQEAQHLPENEHLSIPVQRLPGHGSPVLGVQSITLPHPLDSSFYTWSSDGVVHFWNLDGVLRDSMHVPIRSGTPPSDELNELKVVRAFPNINTFATGDKYGALRVMDRDTKKVIFEAQAHSGEILDIAILDVDEATLLCSAGRDRIVQVFQHKGGNTVLTQTLDEHVSVVNGLLFTPRDANLLSCSFDRTIVIRDRYIQEDDGAINSAFVISKTINLKAAPVAMKLMHNESSLMVSSTDRSIMIYDMELRKATCTFKASDIEKGDPVVLSALAQWRTSNNTSLIAGISSTDKSIRLYQEDGTLVGRDWGHTEGVTDIAVVYEDESHEKASIVTVAADGTIFLWTASHECSVSNNLVDHADALVDQPFPSEPRTIKPLRKLLSQSDLANFRPASANSTPKTSPTATPDPNRSYRLRSRPSRTALAQTPKLEPIASTTATTSSFAPGRHRCPPASPTNPQQPHSRTNTDLSSTRPPRRPSLDPRHRTKSTGNLTSPASNSGSTTNLHDSTTQILRALRTYRKTLSRTPSTANLSLDTIREVEKELNLTAKALAERAARGAGVGEEVMVRLFDEYSERIVRMLDERVEKRMVERGMGASGSEGEVRGMSGGDDAEAEAEAGKEEEERRGSV
ncbi:WD40 repeat-like protein [Viridothelium virens]|uniref:WD40 repeat-like protein n=1 Tax=Viridothelium virens TaxID=1048519 RepID=A0A6A6HGG4_VIRVR|nr:WD40 repeat-like protein [Viridothelium virens]